MVECGSVYSGECESAFIDCTSLNIQYNIFGQATISYVMVHKENKVCYADPSNFVAGDQVYCGYIIDLSTNQIPDSTWYETSVTMLATTTGDNMNIPIIN